MKASEEIEVLIRAKYPILYIVSWEERRVEQTVSSVCTELKDFGHRRCDPDRQLDRERWRRNWKPWLKRTKPPKEQCSSSRTFTRI